MADDPDRDIIPTKEVKHSYPPSENRDKPSPEKRFVTHLSKNDLEDQVYKCKEENYQLKKAAKKQEEEIKKLTTKFNRLSREKKSIDSMNNPGHKRDLELEELVEDLQDKVRQLERSNNQWREKALVARQQVVMQNRRPNPYNHVPPRVNSGVYKSMSSPYVSTINVRGKNQILQNSIKKPTSTPIPPYALSLLEEARNKLSNLKMLVSSQKSEIEMYEQENDILKQKMRMREIEFEDEINSLKSQLTQLQRQHVQENLDLIRLHREVQLKNSKIKNIQAQYGDLEEKMKLFMLKHDHLVKDMEDLELRYKNEQTKNLNLMSELQKAEVTVSSSTELQEKIKSLMNENSVLRETNDKLLQNALAVEKNKSFNQMEEILKGKITNLESMLEIQLKAKGIAEEELSKEREKSKLKEDDYNQLQDHVKQMESHLQNLESKIDLIELEGIAFDDLEKAIHNFKDNKEKQVYATRENCTSNGLNGNKKPTSPLSTDSSKNQSLKISPDHCVKEDSKELLLTEASKEIEDLKLKLSEYEEKNCAILKELQNLQEMFQAQQNQNDVAQEELKSLTEKLKKQEMEFKSKVEELSHLLDIRAARIQKLEKQLNDIAYGTKTFTMPSTNEGEHPSPIQLNRGENIFEIHINKITFTLSGRKCFFSPTSSIFLTWSFYEFELQSTPLVSSEKPDFNFTAQYTVQVDDYFLSYLHSGMIVLELHESLGVDYRTLATCHINFSDIFKESSTKIYGTATLIGEGSAESEFGTVDYWIQLKIPMEEAFKFFKEKIKAMKYIHGNKQTSTAAVQLLAQPYDKDSGVNQLHIKILRATNLKPRQKDVQPSAYCVYKFYDLPDQDTTIIPASNNPEFLDHHTFTLYIDPDIEKYLKNENLDMYVFDDNDPDINSYIGKASISLFPLVQNESIRGSFTLHKPSDDSVTGSLEISIYWQNDYQPATSDPSTIGNAQQKELVKKATSQENKSHSDEEMTSAEEPTIEYSVSTPPVPKPRTLPAKPATSTPLSKNSESSSHNGSDTPIPDSLPVSPVQQVNSVVPTPTERKSKPLNDETDEILKNFQRIKKLYNDDFSDGLSDSEKKTSFDGESDEDKQDMGYSYSDESDSETGVYSQHIGKTPTIHVPSITVLISYLSIQKDAAVLLDSRVKLLYVEYQFLNYPLEELETPISLPKKGYPHKIEYNFKKIFTLEPNNLEKWNLLLEMFASESPQSSLIKFTVVSEPPPEDQDLDCEDVGYGSVDLREILKERKDKVNEDILIYDAKNPSIKIGALNISVHAFEALSFLKTFATPSSIKS